MATLLAATKPQVSARAHNRVLDAAQERVDRLEPRLAAVIEEILGRAGARAATLFHERATRHVVPDASLVAAGPDWSPPFADELIDVDALVKQILAKTEPVRAALIEQTMTPALKQAGLSFDVSNPLTAKLFAETGAQVTNIALTTRANLMDIIGKSYQNGLTIPATRDLIRQGMRTASKTRATMIARTEMARAVNGGSLAATQLVSQETGQNYDKVWHTAPGARYPRHELYEDLDGQTVGMDETFNVGGDQLQYPGDPNGEPGETINCRCALSYTEVAAVRATPAPITNEELDAADSPVLTTGLDPIPNTQDADKLAAVLANRAKAAEEPVSAIMKQVFADANARFAGFKYRLKGLSSTEQKLLDDARDKGITPREDAYQISDMLRYTATFEPDRYLAGVRDVLTDLQDRGFTVDRVRNTWSKDVQYAGINTRISAPNGYRFELQFHTPASFDLKQNVQHKLYEDYRKLDPATPEARALDAQMIQNVRKLDFPQGVEDFKWPETVAPPTAPASAVQSIDIGATPFRAGEDNAVGFYNSTKYRQFIADVNQSAEAYGVHIDSVEKATGVWEGDTEPSVSIHVSPTSPTPESEVYKGQHSAPGPDYGAPMYDLSGEHSGAQIYPEDVYDEKNQVHLYGQGGDAADRAVDQETFNTINAVKGDPSAMVTVYRAVPGDVTAINPGDWVTPSKTYAEHHAEANLGADADGHVVSMQVPAGQLWTDGNSIQEWGWNPPHFEDFNAEARARAFAANLGRAYNQDGVLLFSPSEGDSMMATFRESLPEGKVTAAMDKAGILGGRFTTDGRLQVIGPRTPEFTTQISQLSKELGGITLDTGEPMPLYTAMTSSPGPGSRYFRDVAGFVGDIKTPDQIRTIFQGFATDVSEALDVPVMDVTDHVQMELQKAFKDATQASIEKRDLTQEVTVYGEKPAPGEVQSFFLKPGPGLQPYTVDRDNILVDMDAFRPETASATNEVLISGEKIKPGAVEGGVANTGAYDVARGDFIMMERDEGDYQKALDALTHPKGVTVENVPTAEPPPSASVRRGDPIVAQSMGTMDDLINAPAQKEWLDNLASQDAEAQQEGVSSVPDLGPIGLINQYTQYGSADINDYLAGRTPDLQQFHSTEDVKAAAAKMGQIVDSAPPLPTGTTLYRAVSPTGIDPSLGQQFRDIEKDVMSKPGVGVTPVSELSDRLSSFTVSYSEPPLPTLAIQKQTMTVASGAGDPIGTVSFETRAGRLSDEGTLEPGRQVYINKITLAKPKADQPGDYYRKALAARVYVDQDFKPLVWDNFETLGDAKFGVEMAVQNPSWNLLRVATDTGTPRFWRPSDGPISTDALAFANLDGSARTALKPFMDDLFANRANPTLDILNGQTKALGDWATQRYPTGSYVAMGEPGEFESMTTDPNFASNFKNPNSPGLVFRVVNAKTGAPIWPYSNLMEHEVLAPPGTMYRVRNVEVRPMEGTPGTASLTGSDLIDRVVVTLEEAPPCGPVRASLVAATGVACTNIAKYVSSGDKPATVGNSTLFPGQPRSVADDAAAHRDAAIARFARDNNMSVADYKAAATEAIRSYIDQHPQVRIRLTHQSLEQVLEDGRLKNEFELPGVTPKMTDVRVRAERNLFGIQADANPTSRPIYGYLAGTADETGIVQEYGDMIVNLDPTVNSRATFTIGDSYRAALNHDLSPSLLSDPGIGSWDGSFDIVKAFREGDIGKISRYVEVEIHGGVPVSDIGGITPDESLIVSREDAERVRDAAEAVTELAANYEGTQQASPQVDQAGIPLDKPTSVDVYAALSEVAKNAALRQGALAALIARVGLKGAVADDFVDFSILGDLAEGTP